MTEERKKKYGVSSSCARNAIGDHVSYNAVFEVIESAFAGFGSIHCPRWLEKGYCLDGPGWSSLPPPDTPSNGEASG